MQKSITLMVASDNTLSEVKKFTNEVNDKTLIHLVIIDNDEGEDRNEYYVRNNKHKFAYQSCNVKHFFKFLKNMFSQCLLEQVELYLNEMNKK